MSKANNRSHSDLDTASRRVDAHKTLSPLATMLPRALASDERDTRRYAASQKRWQGVPFSGSESEEELRAFLHHLAMQLTQAIDSHSKILSTPMRALLYIERPTFYALQDYHHELEQSPYMKCLWTVPIDIQRDAQAWYQTEPQDASWTRVSMIQKTLEDVVHNVPSVLNEE